MRENQYILVKDDKYEYIWSFEKAKRYLNEYCKRNGLTKVAFYKTISDECIVTEECVKNWFTRKNGPSDLCYVDTLANHFGINYMDLLHSYDKEIDDLIDDLANRPDSAEMTLNYPTLKFISMLNDLAEMTKTGYRKFSELKPEDDRSAVIYIDDDDSDFGKIVMDMCVDEYHHDVISTYDQYVPEVDYDVRVVIDEDESFIDITTSDDGSIVVENGRWYCS